MQQPSWTTNVREKAEQKASNVTDPCFHLSMALYPLGDFMKATRQPSALMLGVSYPG